MDGRDTPGNFTPMPSQNRTSTSRFTRLFIAEACLLRDQTVSGGRGSSLLPSWPSPPSSYVILFAPRPLQTLQRYYRMIRHLQVHRYFPFVDHTYRFSLSIT